MKKTLLAVGLLSILTLMVLPIQANFVQCPGGNCDAAQGTTDGADLINGSLINDDIYAQMGDDVLFGNEGTDLLRGDEGNDILLGGLGDDSGFGGPGDDVILPGPDVSPDSRQYFNGTEGNDMTIVFAGEISGCLAVDDAGGNDAVNLVGFGPYTATAPFGQPGFGNAYALVTDPITGGFIAVRISENDDLGVETINGLVSPNGFVVTFSELPMPCQIAFN